ncbi:14427_t:CDS:2, partial [Entrophospora sp. SA101]
IKVSNAQYIVANSILYKLEQYFKLPDEAKMIASLLDPYTKCSTFTTDEITRTVTAIKCKLIHYNSSFNINNNNTSTITTNNQTSPSQTIKNRIDACAHIRSLATLKSVHASHMSVAKELEESDTTEALSTDSDDLESSDQYPESVYQESEYSESIQTAPDYSTLFESSEENSDSTETYSDTVSEKSGMDSSSKSPSIKTEVSSIGA